MMNEQERRFRALIHGMTEAELREVQAFVDLLLARQEQGLDVSDEEERQLLSEARARLGKPARKSA